MNHVKLDLLTHFELSSKLSRHQRPTLCDWECLSEQPMNQLLFAQAVGESDSGMEAIPSLEVHMPSSCFPVLTLIPLDVDLTSWGWTCPERPAIGKRCQCGSRGCMPVSFMMNLTSREYFRYRSMVHNLKFKKSGWQRMYPSEQFLKTVASFKTRSRQNHAFS